MEGLEEEEIAQLGLSECFLPGKTAYVEWPEFIRPFLPQDTIELQFFAVPDQPEGRRLLFTFDETVHGWLGEKIISSGQWSVISGQS
jgi:tRNA A37 threonylcarbamoyladenosine biosynthesis protein TsaE